MMFDISRDAALLFPTMKITYTGEHAAACSILKVIFIVDEPEIKPLLSVTIVLSDYMYARLDTVTRDRLDQRYVKAAAGAHTDPIIFMILFTFIHIHT